ncbi:uncharacterized protein DNG_06510 [Cephalotrichum gorgonifer]|uniref:Uncharacterized protein n=1 Tax=Cephalotrichum gorgonifer TaxID=2041049 RepID=A0AAE8SXD1_9PEZI|nr:uncharacterized protein DNG_06510 [Cephalotrichum gorgonifer]
MPVENEVEIARLTSGSEEIHPIETKEAASEIEHANETENVIAIETEIEIARGTEIGREIGMQREQRTGREMEDRRLLVPPHPTPPSARPDFLAAAFLADEVADVVSGMAEAAAGAFMMTATVLHAADLKRAAGRGTEMTVIGEIDLPTQTCDETGMIATYEKEKPSDPRPTTARPPMNTRHQR